jgi:hypothetical protein
VVAAPLPDLVEAAGDRRRVGGLEVEGRGQHDVPAVGLEARVAVGQAEVGGGDSRLRPVGEEDVGPVDDRGDVVVMGAGVGPDRAADGARDCEPELEAR